MPAPQQYPPALVPPPVRWRVADQVDLAAAYHLVDYFGWTELIYGHLTARVRVRTIVF